MATYPIENRGYRDLGRPNREDFDAIVDQTLIDRTIEFPSCEAFVCFGSYGKVFSSARTALQLSFINCRIATGKKC